MNNQLNNNLKENIYEIRKYLNTKFTIYTS